MIHDNEKLLHCYLQVQEEIRRERANMETNLAWKLQQERDQLKKEEDQKIKSMTKGYEQERKLRENMSEQLRQCKKVGILCYTLNTSITCRYIYVC